MRTIAILFLSTLLFLGCKKESIPAPDAVQLLSPLNNNTCLSIPQGNTNAVVNFQWNAAENTDRYRLEVRNTVTNQEVTSETEDTSTSATLLKGAPYAWKIISISDDTSETAESTSWSFYLEATQQFDYIPFPAQLISPENFAVATPVNGNVTLSWAGRDLDNDIAHYDVYLGTTEDELRIVSEDISDTSAAVSVTSSTAYFWRIATQDQNGNFSFSSMHRFQTP